MLLPLLRSARHRVGARDGFEYRPPVTAFDRAVWEGVDPGIRTYWIRRGESYLAHDWPELTEEMYRDFARTGERGRFEMPYHKRRQVLTTLLLAEGFENRGRFLPSLTAGLDIISREPTWVLPAHFQNPAGSLAEEVSIDIFAAETGNALAWVLYVFEKALESEAAGLVHRVRREIRRRIIEPYLSRSDFWWLGQGEGPIGNWTTWCTSNCLGTLLLEELDAESRWRGLEKACLSLSRFLEAHGDGGCDEGPMYWNFAGGCLFDSLEMLHAASGGAFDPFRNPLVKSAATYIRKVHVHDLYFVNFADSPPAVPVDAALVYRFGKRIEDRQMQALGAHLHRLLERFDPERTIRLKTYRALASLAEDAELRSFPEELTHPLDEYLPKIQVAVVRESETPGRGVVLAIKGGHNDEGHNHNDVGNLVVYSKGEPLLIDLGSGEYSKKTFSGERYDLWTMQSAFHNVPLVNGAMQEHGARFTARNARFLRADRSVSFGVDIAAAYPARAGLARWQRTCTLDRERREIRVEEDFQFLRERNHFELRYLTGKPPLVRGRRVRLPASGSALMLYAAPDPTALSVHELPVDDRELRRTWGRTLYQIRLRFEDVGERGVCTSFLVPADSSEDASRSEAV